MSHTDPRPENQAPRSVEPRWRRPDLTKAERNAQLIAFYLAPHSMRQAAAEFGISLTRVRQIIQTAGVQAHGHQFRPAK